jgi:uncharacterized protein YycO
MKGMLSLFAAILVILACGRVSLAEQLQDGDIIFHTSRSAQSVAIQKATNSKYSHMGIILFLDGRPYVYEAINTVQYTLLKEWIDRGDSGHYVVKRLRDADQILTPSAIAKLRQTAKEFYGKPYDLTFAWSDDRIYCSELVWKIYYRSLGIRIGRLQKLSEFDLSDAAVQAKIRERYGSRVLTEETVISPGEMYSAENLRIVVEQ